MSTSLIFPKKVLDQHLVCLGKTGAGKSSALRHIVEYLLSKNKRVCVIDPKGDWNGLKVSGDGKGPGFPVILFGDFKETAGKQIPTDVPINEHSGKHIAELITTGNRPCVVGLRGWTQAAMHRFWIEFASTLFNSNSGEFYLVIDEVHNFAPKGQISTPDAGMSLHWTNRLINEGRGLGLVVLCASQRPQKVHNDTLDACETLVAMRMVHKAARDSVQDWLEGAGDKKLATTILSSLASMDRGEAYVWSPEVKFGPERVTFPMFSTFDSFAPPQLQTKVSAKDWGSVDLEAVKEKLRAVIEKAKAEDPRELQRVVAEQQKEISKLTRQLEQAGQSLVRGSSREEAHALRVARAEIGRLKKGLEGAMAIIIKLSAVGFENASAEDIERAMAAATKEISRVLETKTAAQNRQLESLKREAAGIVKKCKELIETDTAVSVEISKSEVIEAHGHSLPTVKREYSPPPPAVSSNGAGGEKMVPRQQHILNALAAFEDLGVPNPTRESVALFVGRSTRPARWSMDMKELLDRRLIIYPAAGELQLTAEGKAQAVRPEETISLAQFHQKWIDKLPRRQQNLLRNLIAWFPRSISRENLAAMVERSTLPARWSMDLNHMKKLNLIDYPDKGQVAASALLFPPGLV